MPQFVVAITSALDQLKRGSHRVSADANESIMLPTLSFQSKRRLLELSSKIREYEAVLYISPCTRDTENNIQK